MFSLIVRAALAWASDQALSFWRRSWEDRDNDIVQLERELDAAEEDDPSSDEFPA